MLRDIAPVSENGLTIANNEALQALGQADIEPLAIDLNPLALLRSLVTTPVFHPLSLLNNNRGVFGTNMGRLFDEFPRLTPDMVEIVRLLGEGTLAPVVDEVFPFEQAAAAHHYIQERRNFGKVLLAPQAVDDSTNV